MAQWLDHWIFNREDRVRFPRQAGNFFSYASFLCYDFYVVRWGLVRDRTLLSRKWLHVIINDDFLEKGEYYGLGGLVVSALDFQAGYRGFESRSGRDNFQTIITPSSYSMCPGLSIKWTGRRLVTDSGTKCAWVIHESKAVQIHIHHSNRRCLYVPRVPGSVKNPHNNNNPALLPSIVCLGSLCIASKYLFNL